MSTIKQFITLSAQDIRKVEINSQIRQPHIVISISGENDQETLIPNNQNRIGTLHLKFDDVSTIDNQFLYFNRDQAKEILDFVNKYVKQASVIVVQCQAGLSRSVAVASALSKIINYSDDGVFTKGIPNMFVYTTILDTFFDDNWQTEYPNICTIRNVNMQQYLTPAQIRLYNAKENKTK